MRTTSACIAAISVLSATALVGCGGSSTGGSSDQTVVFLGYGGEYKGIFEKTVAEPFTRQTGIKVKYVAGGSATENYAAVRAAGGQTQFDVALVTYMELWQGAKDKLLTPVAAQQVPNLKKIYPAVAKTTSGVGIVQDIQQVVLMYDKKRFSTPPSSWSVMWDARYRKGTIVWNPTNSLGVLQLLTAAKLAGGSDGDVEPGWRKLGELTKDVAGTPTASSEAVPYMEKGTVSAFPYFDGRAAIYAGTTHYDYVTPKEGTYGLLGATGVPVGARHKKAAFALLDFWLGTKIQEQWAQAYHVGPSVSGTTLPPDFAKHHIVGERQLASVAIADPNTVSKHRGEWLQRWQELFS
jgi:putative spermidine/putrescine transport system substrate-binding protein